MSTTSISLRSKHKPKVDSSLCRNRDPNKPIWREMRMRSHFLKVYRHYSLNLNLDLGIDIEKIK